MVEASFDGTAVMVTGAGRGMGRATAEAFARAGASVLVTDVDAEGGEETAASITQSGGAAAFVRTDVSDAAAVEAAVAAAVDSFGGLDFAVNNAGIEIERTSLVDCEEATFQRIIDVNLKGVFLCLKHEVRQMLRQGRGGAIVNMASVNSFRPQPMQGAYTASKHGVIGLTRTAAMEYAPHGIRINAVCPGAIATEMLDVAIAEKGLDRSLIEGASLVGRIGDPAEVAQAVLWLCSPAAAFVVGHPLAVDGGYLAR